MEEQEGVEGGAVANHIESLRLSWSLCKGLRSDRANNVESCIVEE
jgi:hypothetical protein